MTHYQNLVHPEFVTGYNTVCCSAAMYQSFLGNFGQWVASGFESKTKRAAVATANTPDPSIGLANSPAAQNAINNSSASLAPLQFNNYTESVYNDSGADAVVNQPTSVESDIFTGTTTGACDVFHICTPSLNGMVTPTTQDAVQTPAAAATSYTSFEVVGGLLVVGIAAFAFYKWHKTKK